MSIIIKEQLFFCYLKYCINGMLFFPISCIVGDKHISEWEYSNVSLIVSFLIL